MSHWYLQDGSPFYEVVGKNGELRPTTLRDARPVKAVPSVTTIMAIQEKPALINWKQEQLLNAFMRCSPPVSEYALCESGWSEEEALSFVEQDYKRWRSEVLNMASQVGRDAAENGTRIHDAIEEAIKNDFIATTNDLIDVVEPVIEFLKNNFDGFEFVAEASFYHPSGFGGKVDLYGVKDAGTANERRMVLDFKTKLKTKEQIEKLRAYDDHHMQTAAYVVGLEDSKRWSQMFDYALWERYNLFIGYDINPDGIFVPTGLKLTESKHFSREWYMFEKLLEFWKLKNKYDVELIDD